VSNTPFLKVREIAPLLGVSTHTIYKAIKDNDIEVYSQNNKKVLQPKSVRRIFELRGFNFKKTIKPKVINVFGMKGGIGKTSIATAIAEGASRLGFKVLAVDLDMQGNLTQSFHAKKPNQSVLFDVINDAKDIKNTIEHIHDSLDIIPSNLSNSRMELQLSHMQIDTPDYFNQIFQSVFDQYELIIIDCPPSVNKVTSCATCFADLNLIPINADKDSFDGVVMSVSEIKHMEKMFKARGLKINYQIVFNKYDAREKLSLYIMGLIGQEPALSNHLMPIVIRTDTAFKNTKSEGRYIFDINKSSGREDSINLIAEITGIKNWLEEKKNKAEKIGESHEPAAII
jgi:chromosome partitioning protein